MVVESTMENFKIAANEIATEFGFSVGPLTCWSEEGGASNELIRNEWIEFQKPRKMADSKGSSIWFRIPKTKNQDQYLEIDIELGTNNLDGVYHVLSLQGPGERCYGCRDITKFRDLLNMNLDILSQY